MSDGAGPVVSTLLDGRLRCLQPLTGYRIAIDTVLLAAAVPASATGRLLDVGTGTGAAGLCVAARIAGVQIDGLEIQPEFADLARQNADINGLADRFHIVSGDVAKPPATIRPDSYDHVISNPPYVAAGKGRMPREPSRQLATMESNVDLSDWMSFCIRMARTRGTITVVHRADRVAEILAALAGRVGDLVIYPLWPGGDAPSRPAKRVIIQGRKGMQGPTVLATGLVLHAPGGSYTDAARRVLVDAEALEIG